MKTKPRNPNGSILPAALSSAAATVLAACFLCPSAAQGDSEQAVLKIKSVLMAPGDQSITFHFDTQVGKTYRLIESPTLEPQSWQDAGISADGTGATQSLTVPIASPSGRSFFRLTAAPTFTTIPAGPFVMGDQSPAPKDGFARELPAHSVDVGAFAIQATEVTKEQWDATYLPATADGYAFDNAGSGKGPDHPVHSVNWFDVVKWCNASSEREGLDPCYYSAGEIYKTGQDPDVTCDFAKSGYRLPTEAEWEKAARGGLVGQRFPWGGLIDHTRANYNSFTPPVIPLPTYDINPIRGFHPEFELGDRPFTAPVGNFASNGYGLHEMTGNVWEWCWDWYAEEYYASSPSSEPRGPAADSEASRVFRGGSWATPASACRNSHRGWDNPTSAYLIIGFRPVRTLIP